MKRVIVTGGSGFIGTTAVEYLLSQNYSVLNIDIDPPKIDKHKSYWKNVDIRNKELLEKEIIEFNPTHILHLAANLGMDVKEIEFFSANTDGVQNLLDIGRKITDLQQIVFTSSLLVCKNGYIPKDDTDYCPPNLYGESKMIGEQLVRDTKNPNFSWSIVRPTSIWGPWFAYSYRTFFQTIKKGYYFHLGNTKITKPNSFVGNTVFMMTKILFAPENEVNQKTFYLADYPSFTTKEWANTIQRKMGGKPIRTLPIWSLRIVGYVGDLLKKFGFESFPLTSFRLSNMLTGGSYPIENTINVCGNLPYSLDDGVTKTINWMKEIKDI